MKPNTLFFPENIDFRNQAFLFGDGVKVSFFVRNNQLIMAEDCYFFLMASMRKMRMNIPLSYTLEFFQNLFHENVINKGFSNGIILFLAYRNADDKPMQKSTVSYYYETSENLDILSFQKEITLDLIKEITINTSLLSNIRVHSPENIYAAIYAQENDLDDVLLLNSNKRIARSIFGNLLFLEGNIIRIPKQSEGAYISPLMENFVTFIHRNQLAAIEEAEISAFETQKADEIIMISDEKGIFPVKKIRNKTFVQEKFLDLINAWKQSFAL